MKIRNIEFSKLNKKEKGIVQRHFKSCMEDKHMECYKLHKDINDFWEEHRRADTDNGNYDGWLE
jgi:hypothetical protein